jgi:hypothetical protein
MSVWVIGIVWWIYLMDGGGLRLLLMRRRFDVLVSYEVLLLISVHAPAIQYQYPLRDA